MRLVLAVVGVALVLAAPAAGGGAKSCPGPGCLPAGSFSIPAPAAGKISFYEITFTGKATAAPVIAVAATAPLQGKNIAVAAVEGKGKIAGGVAKVTILLGASNVAGRGIASAAGETLSFEGFAPAGTFSPEGYPSVKPTAPAKFDNDYRALENLGFSWQQFWLGGNSKSRDVAEGILANQIKASFSK
jgi:hypothetical protein